MTSELPHRRRNLLTGEWVLVSPHRASRPWQGERTEPQRVALPVHDPSCHLCPGNMRQNGQRNPDYSGCFVFANDFPALMAQSGSPMADAGLFETMPARGEARVVCYSPDHARSLGTVDDVARRTIVNCWCDLSSEMGREWAHVQLFENRGSMMGASSPHPHGQVWASDFIPEIVAREDRCQRDYAAVHDGRPLLDAVAEAESAGGERVIVANDHWLAVVPHWAAWPFETLLIARGRIARLEQLEGAARDSLAAILGQLLARYDALFQCEMPYSMGWHGAPHAAGADPSHWRLHAHFHPPLLRSASVRKHMVGFELMAEVQRDLTPETAAERLRQAAR
jgi:UDPglucose--hexose-1-phosphate uridylyltransferase